MRHIRNELSETLKEAKQEYENKMEEVKNVADLMLNEVKRYIQDHDPTTSYDGDVKGHDHHGHTIRISAGLEPLQGWKFSWKVYLPGSHDPNAVHAYRVEATLKLQSEVVAEDEFYIPREETEPTLEQLHNKQRKEVHKVFDFAVNEIQAFLRDNIAAILGKDSDSSGFQITRLG